MPGQFVRRHGPAADGGPPPVVIRNQYAVRRARDPDTFLPVPRRCAPAPPKRTVVNDRRHRGSDYAQVRHIKLLGEGGQGRCDLYKRERTGELFVYKLMKHSVDVDRNNKSIEAKILQDILGSHERIIQLYDYAALPKQTIFYLEYCSGGDLAMISREYRIRGAQMPETFVWHTYIQLAEAVAYLHSGYNRTIPDNTPKAWQAIAHRDIKPHNVFLRKAKNGRDYPDIVLADFGLATTELYTNQEPDAPFMGTLAYQGPELPMLSRSGDRWSVGACVHQMCTGNPPLSSPPRGVDPVDWTYEAQAREVTPVTYIGYSEELEDALSLTLKAVAKNREGGKKLILAIEAEYRRWLGPRGRVRTPLASWALPRDLD